jgi:hypothetical protein
MKPKINRCFRWEKKYKLHINIHILQFIYDIQKKSFILYYTCVDKVNLHKTFLFWDNKYAILTKFLQV